MGYFYLIAGAFTLILFTIFRFVLHRENPNSEIQDVDLFQRSKRFLLDNVTFFQILGFTWILAGTAFQTNLIHHPSGTICFLLDGLLLLVPVWVFAYFVEKKNLT